MPIPINLSKKSEIAKIATSFRATRAVRGVSFDIEIDMIVETDAGVEVFARAWNQQGKQYGFGKDGSVDLERFVMVNPPVLVEDPSGDIVVESYDELLDVTTIDKYRYDPEEALLQTLAGTIAVKKEKFTNRLITVGKIGNTTTTYHSGGDAWAGRQGVNQTISALSSGVGTNTQNNAVSGSMLLQTSSTTDQFQNQRRGFYIFDTSSLPDADTISSATFSIVASSWTNEIGDVDIELCPTTTASDTSIAASDYNKQTTTRLATGIAASTFDVTGSVYTDFTLNAAGLAHINKTGYTKFGTQSKWSFDSSFTGTWLSVKLSQLATYWADETGTTKDPKLVVEHSVAPVGTNSQFFALM